MKPASRRRDRSDRSRIQRPDRSAYLQSVELWPESGTPLELAVLQVIEAVKRFAIKPERPANVIAASTLAAVG